MLQKRGQKLMSATIGLRCGAAGCTRSTLGMLRSTGRRGSVYACRPAGPPASHPRTNSRAHQSLDRQIYRSRLCPSSVTRARGAHAPASGGRGPLERSAAASSACGTFWGVLTAGTMPRRRLHYGRPFPGQLPTLPSQNRFFAWLMYTSNLSKKPSRPNRIGH